MNEWIFWGREGYLCEFILRNRVMESGKQILRDMKKIHLQKNRCTCLEKFIKIIMKNSLYYCWIFHHHFHSQFGLFSSSFSISHPPFRLHLSYRTIIMFVSSPIPGVSFARNLNLVSSQWLTHLLPHSLWWITQLGYNLLNYLTC